MQFTIEKRGRAAAFLPGGPFAQQLAKRNVVMKVGDTVFVHGECSPNTSVGEPSAEVCAELAQVLSRLGATRRVVGHTPQKTGITSACEQKIWRIDTGMTHMFGGPTTALEIKKGKITLPKATTAG